MNFKANARLFAELQRQSGLIDAMDRLASEGERIAKGLAPVGSAADGDDNPGQFRDSLKGRVTRTGSRVGARVETDDPDWIYKEYGTSDTPAHAVLRRTLDQLNV